MAVKNVFIVVDSRSIDCIWNLVYSFSMDQDQSSINSLFRNVYNIDYAILGLTGQLSDY